MDSHEWRRQLDKLSEMKGMVAERRLAKDFIFIQSRYEQTPELINACDIMVIPRKESFGVPVKLINFMACGKPVVMFKSVSSGVLDGSVNQEVIYEVNNEQQFQEAILALIEDEQLRQRYARNSRQYALQEFSRDKIHNDIHDMYKLLNQDEQRTE